MKNYQLTLTVPDDFDPEKMDLNINYPDGDIGLISESFYDVTDIVKEAAEKMTLAPLNVTSTSVVIFKYPLSLAMQDPALLPAIKNSLEEQLGCTVVGIIDDIDLMVKNSAEAIKMLQQMIDKINSKAIIKLA